MRLQKILGLTLSFIAFTLCKGQNDIVNDAAASNFNLNTAQSVDWFKTVGEGMFVHFGVDVSLGIVVSHALVGASDDFVNRYYSELPKVFNPDKFNPHAMAVLAKLAGMKYVVFTTKHHSGFCMWDTKTTDFNVMNTPYHKDLLREYVDAVRAEGLGVGFYFSPEDFYFLHQHHLPIQRYFKDWTPALRKEFDDYTCRQCEELMTNYGKIDVLFIDGEPNDIVKQTCWKLQPDMLITRGAMNTPEQVLPGQRIQPPWLSCVTMGTAWQYQPTNERYKSGTQLLHLAIEARAKGGSLLLNIGPKADGSIAEEQENRLREMAAWYFINHECMDSVNSWVVSREDDTWFTAKGDSVVYAIITNTNDWKEGERKSFLFHSVKATPNTQVEVLGQNSRTIEYKNTDVSCKVTSWENGIRVSVVKAQRIYDDHRWTNPVVIKLTHIKPRFDIAPVVTTENYSIDNGYTALKGKVYFDKNQPKPKKARFYYRPYAGQVETLYAQPWQMTPWITIDSASGIFYFKMKFPDIHQSYEYRAVADYFGASVDGEDKVYQAQAKED